MEAQHVYELSGVVVRYSDQRYVTLYLEKGVWMQGYNNLTEKCYPQGKTAAQEHSRLDLAYKDLNGNYYLLLYRLRPPQKGTES